MVHKPSSGHHPRRAAPGIFSVAAFAAGLEVPALVTPTEADAKLIQTCQHIADLCTQIDAIYATGHMGDTGKPLIERQLDVLFAERKKVCDQIEELPSVSTMDGARALARASMALTLWNEDGTVSYDGASDWLAGELAEFMAKPVASQATSPDAELIELCAEAIRCEERLRTIDASGAPEDECQHACDDWVRVHEQVANTTATTFPGLRAKATVLHSVVLREAVWSSGTDNDYLTNPEAVYIAVDGVIARSLAADILAMGLE
jgi:hypothetical protein